MERLEIVIEAIDRFSKTFNNLRSQSETIQKKLKTFSVTTRYMEDVERNFRTLGSAFRDVGLQMTIAGGAILSPLGLAVKKFTDFERSMKNVQAVTGATDEEFKKLSNFARKMGADTVFSASEAAQAMYFLGSAGWKSEQMMKGLPGILDLAAATQSDLAQSSAVVVSTLAQFGLEANESTRVADVLTAAINNSQATLEKLQYSLRYVGAAASSAGSSLEETTAALMMLYNAGLTGEMAGTALRGVIAKLLAPSKQMTDFFIKNGIMIWKNSDAVAELARKLDNLQKRYKRLKSRGASAGVLNALKKQMETTQKELQKVASAGIKPLGEIIKELEKAHLSKGEIMDLFDVRAGPAVIAMLKQGSKEFEKFKNTLENSSGTAAKVAKKQLDSLWGVFMRLRSAVEELLISFGDALKPLVVSLADNLRNLVTWFNNLPQPMKNAIAIGTALFGTFLLGTGTLNLLIGTVMNSISTWINFGRTLVSIGPQLGTMFRAFLTFNRALTTVAFSQLGAILRASVTFLGGMLKTFITFSRTIVITVGSQLGAVLRTLMTFGRTFVTSLMTSLGTMLKVIIGFSRTLMITLATNPITWIIAGIAAGVFLLIKYWDKVVRAVKAVWNWLKKLFTPVAKVLGLTDQYKVIWNVLSSVIGLVADIMESSILYVAQWLTSAWNNTVSVLVRVWNFIKTIGDFLKNVFLGTINLINSAWQKFVDLLQKAIEPFKKLSEWVGGIGEKVSDGFKSVGGKVVDWFKGAGEKVIDWFKGPGEKVGEAFAHHVAVGVKDTTPEVGAAVRSMAKLMDDYMPHSPARRGPLSNLDKVGPGFVLTIARGIRKTAPKLESEIGLLSERMVKAYEEPYRKLNDLEQLAERLRTGFEAYRNASMKWNLRILFQNLGLSELWDNLITAFNGMKAFFSTKLGSLIDKMLGGSISKILGTVSDFLAGPAGELIVGAVIAAVNTIFDLFKDQPWFRNLLYGVKSQAEMFWKEFKESLKPLGESFLAIKPAMMKLSEVLIKYSMTTFIKPLISLLKLLLVLLRPILRILSVIVDALVPVLDWLADVIESFTDFLDRYLDPLINAMDPFKFIFDVFKSLAELSRSILSWFERTFGKIFGFAEGGLVLGSGSKSSDSLLARLSPGEFVVNAQATREWYPVLEAINSGNPPPMSSQVNVTINVYDATDPQRVKEVLKEFFDDLALQTT